MSTLARDFKANANNPIQIRLQNEFRKDYDGQYQFEIKRGEAHTSGTVNAEIQEYGDDFD